MRHSASSGALGHVKAIFEELSSFEAKHSDPMKTYEKILAIAQSAIDNPNWRRKPGTQLFYEKLISGEMIEELEPKPNQLKG